MTTGPNVPLFLPQISIQGDSGSGFVSASSLSYLKLDQVASDQFGVHMQLASPTPRQITIKYLSDATVPLSF